MKYENILKDVIGKSKPEATHLCKESGYDIRVECVDGEKYMLTQDHKMNRVNVTLFNGIVTQSRIG